MFRGHANEAEALLPLQLVAQPVGLHGLVRAAWKYQQVLPVGHQRAADFGVAHGRAACQQGTFQRWMREQKLVAQGTQKTPVLLLQHRNNNHAVQGKQAVVAYEQARFIGNVLYAADHRPEKAFDELVGNLQITALRYFSQCQRALDMPLQAFASQGLIVFVQSRHVFPR